MLSIDKNVALTCHHFCFAFFISLYGHLVVSVLRETPFQIQEPPALDNLTLNSDQIEWFVQPLNDLVQRVEIGFKSDMLKSLLKQIPVHRRPLIHTQSQRKTANSLVYQLLCRMS
jgi:hypothetical protein